MNTLTTKMIGWKEVIVIIGFIAMALITNASIIDMVASITGLLCVWLNARESIWNYSFGFINLGAYIYIFYNAKLYADMMLQMFFAVLMTYGIIVWLTKKEGHKVRPTRAITKLEAVLSVVFIIAVTYGWGTVLTHFTDAHIPFLDAFIATMSLVAQYFLSKKVLHTWLFWIAIDVLSIGMYTYKGLYMVAFTYVVFLVIASYGYISWKNEYHNKLKEVK